MIKASLDEVREARENEMKMFDVAKEDRINIKNFTLLLFFFPVLKRISSRLF